MGQEFFIRYTAMTVAVFRRARDFFAQLPPPVPEESIALRVLVQIVVSLGIVATDVAAGTSLSWWAVPAGIVGAFWSWRQRRGRSVGTQLAISLGMLVALGIFFVGLVESLGDTRLTLAILLVHLQVLHSFDLPRRKDLGYSMVIGLILVGVAGTLSQTLWFAPVLAVFLGVALPMLVLDYRSRLGIHPRRSPFQIRQAIPLKRLGILTALVGALGMGLFFVMPRFPGFQVRTLPVSSPIDLAGVEFEDGQVGSIDNPGYDEDGQGFGDGDQDGKSGRVDDTFYYGFSSRINQNLSGELVPQEVLRVRSQAKGFWRVLGFDRYTGQGWEITRKDNLANFVRPGWSYKFLLPPLTPNKSGYQEVIQSYTVVSTLPNLIPAMAAPGEVYFPMRGIGLDSEGGLRSPRVLDEGLTFSIISRVPYRDRKGLQGASQDYPQKIRTTYLEVPDGVRDRLRAEAERLLAKADPPRTSPYEQALFLAQAVKQGFQIQTELPPLGEGQDLVEAFLFERQGGQPDQFPTALAMMLRSLGIPARIAVGFAPGQFNIFTGLYEVYNTDAHAVTEVYFPEYGWFAFDPIPGHPLVPPSVEENQTFSALEQLWAWVAGWLPTPLRNGLEGLVGAIAGFITGIMGTVLGWFSQGWLGAIAGSMAVIVMGTVGWFLWKFWRQWRYHRHLKTLPPMESLYRQMLGTLARDYPKQPWQTPLEYAQAYERWAAEQSLGAAGRSQRVDLLQTISQAYVQWRYGQRSPDVSRLEKQWQNVRRGKTRSPFAAK